jgi:excisionase family DNA binding protein
MTELATTNADQGKVFSDLYQDANKGRRFNPPERLLTPSDVAEWLGVSTAWVRAHAANRQPKLPTVRLGKLMRFRAEEIEQFLKEQGIK